MDRGKGDYVRRTIILLFLITISCSLFAKVEKVVLNMKAEVYSKAYITISNNFYEITSNTNYYTIECITVNGESYCLDNIYDKIDKLSLIKVSSI